MSERETAFLVACLSAVRVYLEFGAGSSTFVAASLSNVNSITSVESDPDFMRSLIKSHPTLVEAELSGRLRSIQPDIGPTGLWGHPLSRAHRDKWPSYATGVFKNGFRPDFVLVDGRFRIACVLASLLNVPEARIAVHDYSRRPHYRLIEAFCSIEDTFETMVILRKSLTFDSAEAKRLLDIYKYDPFDYGPGLAGRIRSYLRSAKMRVRAVQLGLRESAVEKA